MAAFSDSVTSSDNTVQAGTVDLTLDGRDATVTFLDVENIRPGDDNIGSVTDQNTVTLANGGKIDGAVEVTVTDVRDYENDTTKAEEKEDTTAGGELQKYLDVRAVVDGTVITDWYAVEQIPVPSTPPTTIALDSGQSKQFSVEWRFNDPGDKTVNEAQSDRVEIDLTFRLTQTGGV
jgi:hypothetical protein